MDNKAIFSESAIHASSVYRRQWQSLYSRRGSQMNKKLDRRSFLRRVGATASIGALGVVTGTAAARRPPVSDGDTATTSGIGRADPGNQGWTGKTDLDVATIDRPSHGRGGHFTNVTDSDEGAEFDRPHYGRDLHRSGLTDSDSGSNADPGGNGRGGRRSSINGVTDADSGSTADVAGYGRGVGEPCWPNC